MKLKDQIKLDAVKQDFKRHCVHCGHTISFYAFEKDKKVCNWCGNTNYRDEKAKFKDILKIAQIKAKRK